MPAVSIQPTTPTGMEAHNMIGLRSTPRPAAWLALALTVLTTAPALAERALLRVCLRGAIAEAPNPAAELMQIFGEESVTLYDCVRRIERGAKDAGISGMVLIVEDAALSLVQAEELSRAIAAFKAKGKKVHCYLDSAGNVSYALASVADDITLAPNSSIDILGLRAELMFYKGLLEKLGIEAQGLHCGAYKSAMEPFLRSEPSPELAENINWLLDGLFDRWVELMASNRKLDAGAMKDAINAAPINAADSLKRGLVDHVAGYADFQQRMRKEYGDDVELRKKLDRDSPFKIDMNNPFAIFQLFGELMEKASKPKEPGIGLIYIEGPIVTGSQQDGPFAEPTGASTTIRAAFDTARTDPGIKAVVCRVNSPGGSALASDIIWEAATRCAKEKPLIVSMGSVAGSGGYYVAIPGQTILAEACTITGSIGVVGGKLALRGLLTGKLGITVTSFTRGENTGLMSAMDAWNDAERAHLEKILNDVYDQFKGRIRQSRGERLKGDLEQMAGGRVYTGRQALEKGLVDQIGGLSDAIRIAADKVGLSDPKVYILPKQPDLAEIFKKLSGEESEDAWDFRKPAAWMGGPNAAGSFLSAALPLLEKLAPEQARALGQALTQLSVLQRERVGCFMPLSVIVK